MDWLPCSSDLFDGLCPPPSGIAAASVQDAIHPFTDTPKLEPFHKPTFTSFSKQKLFNILKIT
jgi:hypothetical protein